MTSVLAIVLGFILLFLLSVVMWWFSARKIAAQKERWGWRILSVVCALVLAWLLLSLAGWDEYDSERVIQFLMIVLIVVFIVVTLPFVMLSELRDFLPRLTSVFYWLCYAIAGTILASLSEVARNYFFMQFICLGVSAGIITFVLSVFGIINSSGQQRKMLLYFLLLSLIPAAYVIRLFLRGVFSISPT